MYNAFSTENVEKKAAGLPLPQKKVKAL